MGLVDRRRTKKVYPQYRSLPSDLSLPQGPPGPTGPQGDSGTVRDGIVSDAGMFTADGSGTAVVETGAITSMRLVLFCVGTPANQGNPPRVISIVDNTSFTVTYDPGDTSTYYWIILPQRPL